MSDLVKLDPVIAKLQTARDALASATTIQDVKKIADVAAAAEIYARRQQLGEEAIGYAHAIKYEALARLGELLKALPRAKGNAGPGRGKAGSPAGPAFSDAPTYAELGLNKKTAMVAKQLASLPVDVRQAVADRETTLKNATKREERRHAEEERKNTQPLTPDGAELRVSSMADLLGSLADLDAIITDPPYEEEAVPLYAELAQLAKFALAPHGILAVMCGQSYLPHILSAMAAAIPYRWTLAYLTPGGQSPQIWPRKVNTFWKPILLFGASEDWIGDVIKSDVNDNDKRFHHWGQSESGMARLVERLTQPGQLVCDPFLGAGTTGVVALGLGRRFIGGDLDAAAVQTARARMQHVTA